MASRRSKEADLCPPPSFPSARDVPPDHTEWLDESVCELVEPEGEETTYYGPVIKAMADRLNCWQLTGNAKVEDARTELYTALTQITELAARLDALVEAANAD